MSTFEIVRGVEGDCLVLNDTRICGPKPWGGGRIIKTFRTDGVYEVIDKDEYRKLMAENEKLRERIHELEMEGSDHFYRMAYAEDANRTLEHENAKLQDENARLRSCLSDDAENARMIMGENSKLRELLAELYQCSRQVGCDHCGDGYRRTCSVLNYLRELGMEVVV